MLLLKLDLSHIGHPLLLLVLDLLVLVVTHHHLGVLDPLDLAENILVLPT